MKNLTRKQLLLWGLCVAFVLGSVVFLGTQHLKANSNRHARPQIKKTQQGVGKLQIEDIKVGEGKEAQNGQTVTVHYTGTLHPSGDKFDSSLDRGTPFSFGLGAGHVIPGWEKGVLGMKEGGKRVLIIPPDDAYGARGVPGAIPPSATLKFEIELISVK